MAPVGVATKVRRDVERNREAIVTAAIAVLADAPQATMNDIAHASGFGRSTLYRHFPDRSSLIEAIHTRVLTEAGAVMHAHLDAAGDREPVMVLTELASAIVDLGDRYRFLERREGEKHSERHDEQRRRQPLLRYLATAQASGAIRGDLDRNWLFTMVVHTCTAAIEHCFASQEARRQAVAATIRTLLSP